MTFPKFFKFAKRLLQLNYLLFIQSFIGNTSFNHTIVCNNHFTLERYCVNSKYSINNAITNVFTFSKSSHSLVH